METSLEPHFMGASEVEVRLGVRLEVRLRNREMLCELGFQEIGVRLRAVLR